MENSLNRKRSTSTLANTISFTHTRPLEEEVRSPTALKPPSQAFGYLHKNGSNSTLNSITQTLSNVGFTPISQTPQSPYSPDSGSSVGASPVLGKVESKLARAKLFAKTKTKELKRSKTISSENHGHGSVQGSFLKLNTHGHHGLSSSSSNSKVVDSSGTLYSFDPSQLLDKDVLMRQLQDVSVRNLTFDERDETADNLWVAIMEVLRPLFKINDGKNSKGGLRLKTPIEHVSKMLEVYLKLRIRNNVSCTNLLREVMDFFKEGMNILENELSFVEDIGDEYFYRMSSTWEYYFKSIYHYLLAVFQPLDLEMSGDGPLIKDRSYWDDFSDSATPFSMKRLLLLSFRDYVVIPYFEMNVQIPELHDKERKLMIQCFGMLKTVKSAGYDQRIVEHISGALEQQLTIK